MKRIAHILFIISLAVFVLSDTRQRAYGLPVAAGEIRFQQSAYNVAEDAGMVTLTLERVNGSDGSATLSVDTFDGSAIAGQDYPATAESVTFGNGETQKTVSIPIIDNGTFEPSETFEARVSLITGSVTIGQPSSTTITILDNDTSPPGIMHFSSSTYAQLENAEMITITVQRSGGTNDQVQVSYQTFNAGADAGSDYMSALGTLTFPNGTTQQTFSVTLLDDPGAEGSENFTIQLYNVVGVASLGTPFTSTVTIIDNETAQFVYLPILQR